MIKKLDTKSGKKENPNGLGEPAIVDHNGDHIIDYVYVGDLRGQLWKFDVTSKNSNDWKSAFGSSKPQPLFQAEAKGVKQPITVKPTVMKMRAPLSGLLVHFGTGRYLTVDDAIADQDSVQTFYGIWDNGTNNASRSKLIKRKIMREDSVSGLKLRTTSSNEKDAIEYDPSKHMGWYLDLVYSGDDRGERVISDPVLRNGEIYFTTFMPSSDGSICNASASGTLMVLNARTGGRLLYDSVLSEDSKGIRDSKGKIPSGVIVDTGGPTGVAIGVYKGRDTIYTGTTDRKVVSINKEAAPGVFGPQTERRISTF